MDSLLHPAAFTLYMTAKDELTIAGDVLRRAVDVVATAAAKDVTVFAAKTLSIRRARSQRIGHTEIWRSLLVNQLFGIHLIADHEIPSPAFVAEFVGRFLGSALRKDPVVFLVFRRAGRDGSQVA